MRYVGNSLRSLIVFVLGVAIIGGLWVNRYNIQDYLILRGYSPPVEIIKLADDDSFNDFGKRLFYVNKPQISDKSVFNSQCTNSEQTIVLGCYTGRAIYIFKVEDPSLTGVEQVTAAHEMLHAAYARLSSSERKYIDELTAAAYKKVNSSRISSLAESYDKQSPGSVPNELHSILATEVSDVGSELEAYYSRYFTNRQQVVNYAKTYEQVFEDLKTQVENYDADLALRRSEITQREGALSSMADDIKAQKNRMDQLLASGQINAYNNQVSDYNQNVASYNDGVAELKNLIDEFNAIVLQRNAIVVQQQNLAKSIDSRPSTISN